MKNPQTDKLEKVLKNAFHSSAASPSIEWRRKLMTAVRNEAKLKHAGQIQIPAVRWFSPALAWQCAMASVAVAVASVILYLSLGAGASTQYLSNDLAYDSFENYMKTVSRL